MTEQEELEILEMEAEAALAMSQPKAEDRGSMDAAIKGAVDMLLFGGDDELFAGINTGFGYVGDYEAERDRIRGLKEQTQEQHPVAFGAGQVAGALPSMVVPGLNAVRGASLGSNLARGVAGGAATGAAYGFGSGEDGIGDRVLEAGKGAAIGGAVGGAVPMAGSLFGNAVRAYRGVPSGRAANLASRAVADDLGGVDQALGALDDIGEGAVLADVGPNTMRQAGALASVPGPAQTAVREYLETRARGANQRILSGTDDALGAVQDPELIDQALRQAQREELGPLYESVLGTARAVDMEPVAQALDSVIPTLRGEAQAAARTARQMLDVTGTPGVLERDPRVALQVRHQIDDMLDKQDIGNNTARILGGVRRQVDEILARAAPGIKDVDAQFQELAKQREALERGSQILDTGKQAVRPGALEREIAASSTSIMGPSGVPIRLREGARAEIDRILGTKNNDVVALQSAIKGDGSWNRQKLVTLFGEDRADRLFRLLERERRFAETAQTVMRNSETAARQLAQAEVAPAMRSTDGGLVRKALNLRPGDAAFHLTDRLSAALAARRSATTNEQLARLLTTPSAGGRNAAVEEIARALLALRGSQAAEIGADQLLTAGGRGALVPYLSQ
jgi:hypothetical protein